jgi:hypothetical protein
MKKVIFFGITLLALVQVSFGQIFTSSFEVWNNPNSPSGWLGSQTHTTGLTVNQSTDAQDGAFSCQLINTGSTHRRFTTQPLSVTAGTVYTITFYVKGAGEVRTGLATPPFGTSDFIYNPYITATSTWTQHTQNITAPASADAQFIISLRNTAEPTHILIDNVTINTTTVSLVPIHDIQFTNAPDGASPFLGQTLTTTGVVTGTYVTSSNQHGYFLQDGSGAWNGIHVYQGSNSNLPSIGNQVQVTGTVAEFNGLTQLTNVTTVVLNQAVPLPAPIDITTLQLSSEEQWEGVLVRVVEVECTNANSGFGMWEVNDGSGPAKVHNLMFTFGAVLGGEYTITGVVNYSFDEFRICPRNSADIVVLNSNVQEVSIQNIQFTTASDGVSQYVGQTVSTRGVVTGVWPTQGFFIQDGSGPWSGIFVFNATINPSMGDSIALTGNVVEYFGLTQISSVVSHEIISTGNSLPAPTVITTAQANSEQYESVLVRVENAICTNNNAGFGMFRLNNSTADMLVDDDIFAYAAVLGNGYNAQGHMWFSYGEFKMLPRMASDIELIGFASLSDDELKFVFVHPNPAADVINVVNFEGQIQICDASGRVVKNEVIHTSNQQIDIRSLENGVYFVVGNGQATRFVKH